MSVSLARGFFFKSPQKELFYMIGVNSKSTKTAKLDRELFFQIEKGNVKITGNAINFMFYTIPFLAKDGRIYRDRYQICNNLCM
jgi:hypothetical protein